ncbi:MAG TPA: glutamate ABC transporter substrate-binding protein [Micromonosporaceae bacterium]
MAVGLATVVASVAACSSEGAPQSASSEPIVAVPPQPQGVQVSPSEAPVAAGSSGPACNPFASGPRPPVVMPPAGHMPPGSTMATIQGRGRLIVGVDQNTYKFGYLDPATGQIVGFDIDIAHAVAKAIFGDPNKIQFVAITTAQRIPDVQNHTVDLVADTMTVNCDRLKQVAFSSIYYDAGQSVLVRKDSSAIGIASLGGKKVCAAAGSTSIANIAAQSSKPIPVSVTDWTDCLVMLQQGQVDAISTDDTILRGLAAQDPDTKLVGQNFTQEPYGLAMNRNAQDFVAFVNGVLQQLRTDGGWAAIYAKWLGTPVPAPPAAGYGN